MSICENVSELLHELRCAAGTVLTILGSRLEAQERARVDEVGPQWLTEFEEQRDSLDAEQLFECVQPDCGCHDDERYTPIPDDVCDEAEAAETADDAYSIEGLFEERNRRYAASLQSSWRLIPDSSAAVSAAADPSPTVLHATDYPVGRVVGGEGPGPDSVIRKTVGSGQPTDPGAVSTPAPGERAGNTICGICRGPSGQCDCVARMFGDTVSHEDLAAHITAAHRQADEIAAYEATYASTGDHIANSLLADFRITKK